MLKLAKTAWVAFLLTFPFSLQFIVYEEVSYRFGNFSPWVTGLLHAPEFLLWAAFALWAISNFEAVKEALKKVPGRAQLLVGAFVLNLGMLSFWKGDMLLYGFFLLRATEALMVFLLLRAEIIPVQKAVRFLLFGALFQLIVGALQLMLNHSVGLHFLGEPHIGPTVDNVAKVDLEEGMKRVRPYGTTLHPNILAAYLMSVFLLALPHLKKPSAIFWGILLFGGVLLTGSRAAMLVSALILLSMALMSAMSHMGNRVFLARAILMLFALTNLWVFFRADAIQLDDPSLMARLEQTAVSHDMLMAYPSGVGASGFTLQMENFAERKLAPWEFQPVHNVYFLVANESGIQGLLMLILAICWMFATWSKKPNILSIAPLLALVLIAGFDHLLWSSFVGMTLIVLVLGFRGNAPDVS